MSTRPDHLSEREYRVLAYVEELARAEDLMRQQVRMNFGDAAELNVGQHEGAVRVLKKVARRMRRGDVPGW